MIPALYNATYKRYQTISLAASVCGYGLSQNYVFGSGSGLDSVYLFEALYQTLIFSKYSWA